MRLTLITACGLILAWNGAALGDVYLEGEVTGALVTGESPYYVIDNISVPTGEELSIEPGVDLIFLGSYTLSVEGGLYAEGGLLDRQRIFIGNDTLTWGGIRFTNSNVGSILLNCDVTNAWIAVECINSHIRLEKNRIIARNIAVRCDRSSPEILQNILIRVEGNDDNQQRYTAISLHDESSPTIFGNERIECLVDAYTDAYGIYARDGSAPNIRENRIRVVSYRRSHAVDLLDLDDVAVVRNIIEVSAHHDVTGMITESATGIEFYSNDVIISGTSDDGAGIDLGHSSQASVINNIFVGNYANIGVKIYPGISMETSGYNAFWMNFREYEGDWAGFAETNFTANPRFVNFEGGDYHLVWENYPDDEGVKSPCIDNGHPGETWFDPDTTRSDIGRYYFNQYQIPDTVSVSIIPPVDYGLPTLYPNPFNARLTVMLPLDRAVDAQVRVFNLQGAQVATLYNGRLEAGRHQLIWSAAGMPAGTYILKVRTGTQVTAGRAVYLP